MFVKKSHGLLYPRTLPKMQEVLIPSSFKEQKNLSPTVYILYIMWFPKIKAIATEI